LAFHQGQLILTCSVEGTGSMAISPRMLAVVQRADAARDEVFRRIRKLLELEAAAKERAKLRPRPTKAPSQTKRGS